MLHEPEFVLQMLRARVLLILEHVHVANELGSLRLLQLQARLLEVTHEKVVVSILKGVEIQSAHLMIPGVYELQVCCVIVMNTNSLIDFFDLFD